MATSDFFPAGNVGHVGPLLSEYLDGVLPADQRAAVDSHLTACARCARDLATLRFTVQLTRQLPLAPVPRSFVLTEPPRRASAWFGWLRVSTGALAALLVALIAAQVLFSAAPAPSRSSAASRPALGGTVSTSSAPRAAAQPPSGPAAAPAVAAGSRSVASNAGGASPPSGPSQRQAMAVAAAPTSSPYPAPVVPVQPAPSGSPTGYPAPLSTTAPVAPTAPGVYPAPGAAVPTTAPPPVSSTSPPQPTVAPPPAPTRSFTMTPAIVIVALLLVLSGAALVLLGRRRE